MYSEIILKSRNIHLFHIFVILYIISIYSIRYILSIRKFPDKHIKCGSAFLRIHINGFPYFKAFRSHIHQP